MTKKTITKLNFSAFIRTNSEEDTTKQFTRDKRNHANINKIEITGSHAYRFSVRFVVKLMMVKRS